MKTRIYTVLIVAMLLSVPIRAQSTNNYRAGVTQHPSAPIANDTFTICGSATKTVRVHNLSLEAQKPTGPVVVNISIFKRTTADTGGNAISVTAVNEDGPGRPGATAAVRRYTGYPTVGTELGLVATASPLLTGNTEAEDQVRALTVFPFRDPGFVLSGAAECMAVNLNLLQSAGTLWSIWTDWTEQ